MNVRLLRKGKATVLIQCAALAAMLAGAAVIPFLGGGCSSDGSSSALIVADAATGKNLLVGRQIKLDGSRSRDSRGRTIEFHWNILDRPLAS